ncbi:hypothetical protein KW476_11060 [Vibrio fluvialis]|nr:hypothetical protein [Vibrio fluvialis]MBY8077489.1 hypothetical protein [Vibrio fluvialis]MBY8147891.1 hypothetical protein [Vibrio fluvialis]
MENKIYIIGVNYGTSNLIIPWYNSVVDKAPQASLVVVNNYHSSEENERVNKIVKDLDITLISSENVGYGRALNKAINKIKSEISDGENVIFLCGNLDIKFKEIPKTFAVGKKAYVPVVSELGKNRNPFITKIQKRFLPLHKLSINTNNIIVFMGVITILKILSFIPSKIWATHGSLFCFNSSCLCDDENIFNEDTFLYSEELEFASYIESIGAKFVNTSLTYEHMAHAATFSIISDKSRFFEVWKPGFINWLKRWSFDK